MGIEFGLGRKSYMTGSKTLIWGFCIASWALLAAVAVYCFARVYPPEILSQYNATYSVLAAHTGFLGSAPSFFYTLAFGVFIGASAPSLTAARWHCLVWVTLVICLELSQQSTFSRPLIEGMAGLMPESIWQLVEPYWTRGIFDILDLLATLAGGYVAILILSYIPRGHKNENNNIF